MDMLLRSGWHGEGPFHGVQEAGLLRRPTLLLPSLQYEKRLGKQSPGVQDVVVLSRN
jgi:hypothetical protein